MSNIHKSAIGVDLIVTIKESGTAVDISTASTKQLILRKPSGSTATKSANFVTDGTDGKLHYTTISGDLDEAGGWGIQAYLVLATGFNGKSDIETFQVDDNIA